MRVAYYSPLPPSRSGIADYSALLLPALEERMDVVVARPGRFRRAPKADVSLSTTSATIRPSTAGSSRRSAAGPASSSCTSSCSTTSSPGSRSPAATSRATARRSSARRGPRGASSDWPSSRAGSSRSGRRGRSEFPLAHGVLDAATGLIVHSALRRGPRARRRLRPPDLAGADAGLARTADRPGAGRRQPRVRLLRARQREQADPAAPRGVRAAGAGGTTAAGRLLVAAPAADRAARRT